MPLREGYQSENREHTTPFKTLEWCDGDCPSVCVNLEHHGTVGENVGEYDPKPKYFGSILGMTNNSLILCNSISIVPPVPGARDCYVVTCVCWFACFSASFVATVIWLHLLPRSENSLEGGGQLMNLPEALLYLSRLYSGLIILLKG